LIEAEGRQPSGLLYERNPLANTGRLAPLRYDGLWFCLSGEQALGLARFSVSGLRFLIDSPSEKCA
jgi:hypothetical protein